MAPHLLVRTGGCAGLRVSLREGPLRIGRREDLDVVLDAERDLEVSALHAELRKEADGWHVRDLGSRNGTYLNGRPVGEVGARIGEGDEIRLGPEGPVLELRPGRRSPAGAGVDRPAASPPATARVPARSVGGRSRLVWFAVGTAGLLLVVAVAALLLQGSRERAAWERERAALERRADSVLQAGQRAASSLEGELGELAGALEGSRSELERIRAELRASEEAEEERDQGDATSSESAEARADTEDLRRRLRAATAALERQQLAASLDFEAIQAGNRRAVALVFVERPDGTVTTGTAFAVDAAGILVTNRHVVLGEEGTAEPTRLAVQFADSRQVFPGRLRAASTEWDLAAIEVQNVEGAVPTVVGLNLRPDTLAAGTPLATLGFPLGGELDENGASAAEARPLLSAGILTGRGAGSLQIQGYGESGASGSPIFDATGAVVGVLFGGRVDGDTRTLLAVPAAAIPGMLGAARD